jgi:aminoglycoside phosphotransferase (APT) family kinase protein
VIEFENGDLAVEVERDALIGHGEPLSVDVKGATIPSFRLGSIATVRLPAPLRPPWHDDYPQRAEDVARVLAADVPAFAGCHVVSLGEGWDYTTFLVDDVWVFRFPKRRQRVRGLLREVRLLEAIAPLAGVAGLELPRYAYLVQRPVHFPVAYAGYRFLAGAPLAEVPATPRAAGAVGRALGAFLAHLHAASPESRPALVADDFEAHLADFRRDLDSVRHALPPEIAEASSRLLMGPLAPWRDDIAFVHGDLGAEHVLCDADVNACAIIDWGDAGWGNPLGDFVGLWAWGGDAAARAAFEAAARAVDQDAWRALRQRSACYAIGTFHYGYKAGQEVLRAAGLEWLTRMHRNGQLLDPGRADA